MERRPLKSRSTGWARATARWMAQLGVTPNQVSILSMVGAAVACGAFAASLAATGLSSRAGATLLRVEAGQGG